MAPARMQHRDFIIAHDMMIGSQPMFQCTMGCTLDVQGFRCTADTHSSTMCIATCWQLIVCIPYGDTKPDREG